MATTPRTRKAAAKPEAAPKAAPKTRKAAAKPAPKPQPQARPATTSTFSPIGALFEGKQEGEYQIKLDNEFLEMLGFDTDDNTKTTLVVKNRVSEAGYEFRSVFFAHETTLVEEVEDDDDMEEMASAELIDDEEELDENDIPF